MISSFAIDRFEVTNAEFAAFVAATGYVTDPERSGVGWHWDGRWRDVRGADWRHPHGPDSSIADLDRHPVVQVSWSDARRSAAGVARGSPPRPNGSGRPGVRASGRTHGAMARPGAGPATARRTGATTAAGPMRVTATSSRLPSEASRSGAHRSGWRISPANSGSGWRTGSTRPSTRSRRPSTP